MSFNNKQGDAVISTKLTTIGRQLLAHGSLNFSSYAVGDSEINYATINESNIPGESLMVLRPVDNQPTLRYPITKFPLDTAFKYPVTAPYPTDNIIVNPARERGFFVRSTPGDITSAYALNITTPFMRGTGTLSNPTGTNILTLNNPLPTGVGSGDYVLVQWLGPNATIQSAGVLANTKPGSFIWYKIKEIAGLNITVDRKTPNYTGYAGTGNAYFFPGGDSIKSYFGPDSPGDYWDPSMLAFNAAQNATYVDVPVWNLSIVYDNTVPGAGLSLLKSGYPTAAYEGIRVYFQTDRPGQPVGLVHYSNYTVENYYGEGFNKDSFTLELPTIMYHRAITAKLGVTLKAGDTKKVLNDSASGFSTPYYDLRDPLGNVVGKVFIDLKVAVIEDPEILAALSYTSGRNWTLPSLKNVDVLQKTANPNFVGPGMDLHFTYRFANFTSPSNQVYNAASGNLGQQGNLHCQTINKITGIDTNSFNGVDFKFDGPDLKFLTHTGNFSASKDSGFSAPRLVLLFQFTAPGAPSVHDRWVELDFTPSLQGVTNLNCLSPESLSARIYRVGGEDMIQAISDASDLTTPYYNLNYLSTTGDNIMTFGEEVFLLGNVKVDIQAISYKTRFTILLGNGEFSASRNPSWTLGAPVFISEVGIYDDLANLVAIGKLSHPLRKDAYSLRFITADLDF